MGKTYQSVVLNKSIDKVWETLANFHDLSWAPNVVKKVDKVGDVSGDQVGAKRVLNDAFHETLLEVNSQDYSIGYSIDEAPSPISSSEVNNYRGKIKLTPVTLDGTTLIEWSSSWENNDEKAQEFCSVIYNALLNDLKSTLS